MSHLIAGIDESLRPRHYLMCATVVSTNDRAHVRQALRGLLLPNQRRLHANNEREGRRRSLLKAMSEIPGVSCHVVIGPQRRERGRELCLARMMTSLLQLGVREVLVERVDHGTAKADRTYLGHLTDTLEGNLVWRHEAPEHEPLLWISDFVAFAHHSGADLRKACQPLVASLEEVRT